MRGFGKQKGRRWFHVLGAVSLLSSGSSLANDGVGHYAATPETRLKDIGRKYGIDLIVLTAALNVKRNDYTIAAQPVAPEVLARYIDVFSKELERYPRGFFARVRLSRIILGVDLKVLGQPRAAVPEEANGWFWLDAGAGSRLPAYGRHVFHHDLFHIIDARLGDKPTIATQWSALNPEGFQYGKGGWFMQSGNVGALREDLPGFLDEYATSAVEEDRAEVFGHLISSPGFMKRRMSADPVLLAKVARIKCEIARFEPKMNATWWARQSTD